MSTKKSIGWRLLRVIEEKSTEEGLNVSETAQAIGINPTYLSQLRSATRCPSRIDKELIIQIANWLNLPSLAVMILADQVKMEDFYSNQDDFELSINRAVKFILADPSWGSMMPKTFVDGTKEEKIYMIWCYEQATKSKLLTGGIDYLKLLQSED